MRTESRAKTKCYGEEFEAIKKKTTEENIDVRKEAKKSH
jgi:hypothetical protein